MPRAVPGEDRFTTFVSEGQKIKRDRERAIRQLKAAGCKEVAACAMVPGGIWVGKSFYLNPERALAALAVR